MPVTPVGSNTDGYSTGISSNPAVMGKDDFLQMLVTQLKYQDPLSPTTNENYTSKISNVFSKY